MYFGTRDPCILDNDQSHLGHDGFFHYVRGRGRGTLSGELGAEVRGPQCVAYVSGQVLWRQSLSGEVPSPPP